MEIDELVKIIKQRLSEQNNVIKIPIEASGRHIHLSKKEADILFGKDYNFTITKKLSQIGEYACKERIRLIGPKGMLENVVIIGPLREKTQVEISLTDSKILGVEGILKNSGSIENTPGILLSNGEKIIRVDQGVIIAKNHLHMNKKEANILNVKDKDVIKVKIYSKRPLIFEDVTVRVQENFCLSMHIDYDEANAAFLSKDSYGVIYE